MTTATLGATILKGIPDGWYSIGQAAKMIGRSTDTLRKYERDGIFIPSGVSQRGELEIRLYSEEDIAKLRVIAREQKPGPKPKG